MEALQLAQNYIKELSSVLDVQHYTNANTECYEGYEYQNHQEQYSYYWTKYGSWMYLW